MRADQPWSAIDLVRRKRTARADHEVVAMDHLGASADAEDRHDIARRAALDLLRVLGVIGHKTSTDLTAIRPAYHHGIAAGELPVDPDDTRRQQALAGAQRVHRAGVDGQGALG